MFEKGIDVEYIGVAVKNTSLKHNVKYIVDDIKFSTRKKTDEEICLLKIASAENGEFVNEYPTLETWYESTIFKRII